MKIRVPLRLPPPWLITSLGCVAIYLAAWLQYRGPAPRAADAPATEFSAARALIVLKHLLGDQSPHPVGTPQNARVRQRLMGELERLGLDVETQESLPDASGSPLVTNVLARLPGISATGRPLVLATHYDSTAAGPGAGDAGSCVAALVECARALRASAPCSRSIYFLFTDGEEAGLLGAHLFVRQHPLAAQRPCVLNFDARCNRGASLMYETSRDNLALVGLAARDLPRPAGAASSFVTVYRWLPNHTDFTVFQAAGWAGLNFGNIGGAHWYHTAADTLANLDPRAVQHHGENALALARTFAAAEGEELAANEDAVFCDLLGTTVIWYSTAWSLRLAALALAMLVCAERKTLLSGGLESRRPAVPAGTEDTGAAVLRGDAWRVAGTLARALLEVVGLAALSGWAISRVYLGCGGEEHPPPLIAAVLAGLFWLVAATITLVRSRRRLRAAQSHSLWLATWLVWNGVGVLAAWLVPGFSYVFLLPCLLAGSVAWLPGARRWWSVVTTLGAALLLLPTLHLLTIALGPSFGHILCPAFAFALLPIVVLPGRSDSPA